MIRRYFSGPYRHLWWVVLLAACFLLGTGMRRQVYEAQVQQLGAPPAFTLESALHYRLLDTVSTFGSLPRHDYRIEYPDGIVLREVYTIGSEFVVAPLADMIPADLSFPERVRWVQVLWFCLGIPLMGLWIAWAFRSRVGGIVAALFYAVSLASVIRSTGQEISRENFALPLLIGHLAFQALALRTHRRGLFLVATVLSAGFLGGALWTWDLIQYYLFLWMLAIAGRSLVAREQRLDRLRGLWIAGWLVLVGIGLVNPYFRSHHFLSSPVMLLSYGIVLFHLIRPREILEGKAAVCLGLAAILGPFVLGLLLPNDYAGQYGHFGDLLVAKIRFLNNKPLDPSMLNYEQRIMWVPALNSANWSLTLSRFPTILFLSVGALILFLMRTPRFSRINFGELVFFFIASLLTFVFFVRFHVFTVIFAAGLLGAWCAASRLWPYWARTAILAVLLGAAVVEAAHVLERPERWGRHRIYYNELDEMVQWMEEHAAPDPVLANFGVSASILAYGRCPIILHPKFETADIRNRVRDYGELLYTGTEEEFRDWADQFGARYYVHSMGGFAKRSPRLQMRYFVDAMDPPDHAPARLFEYDPDACRYFILRWSNRKYRVFQMITKRDERLAREFCRQSREAFQRGALKQAEELATRALLRVPEIPCALEIIRHVNSLLDQGFSVEASTP